MTQEEKMSHCTPRQIDEARTARDPHHDVGTPTVRNVKGVVRGDMIEDCPVTVEHVDRPRMSLVQTHLV